MTRQIHSRDIIFYTSVLLFSHQAYLGNTYNIERSKNGDTATDADAAQNQYISLPYPAVTTENLFKEKQNYISGKKNTTYSAIPSLDLEYINHFLYRGGNDFT